jgi:8-hydroxy-5-deazaflavin:NADPH oxidoreductase
VRVGVLGGTGPAGSGLALRLADVGVPVVIGSRSAERALEQCAALAARWPERSLAIDGGDNAAAAAADIVVVATPWDAAASTALSVSELLAGKVVVSMANALAKVGAEFDALVPPRGSVAAHVQSAVPDAFVSAAFHHLPAKELADLAHPMEGDVLVCSDHIEATKQTCALVGAISGLRALDAGSLANASAIEAFTAVLLQLNVRYKTRAGLSVTGIRGPL